jgi:hypothetical protein
MWLVVGILVGYFAGMTAASNIVLPLFWAWPKAHRLSQEGRLVQNIPVARFLTAPFIWTVILILFIGIAFWFSSSLGSGLAVGLMVGAAQVGTLVAKPNEHMEQDFRDAYGEYLKDDGTNDARAVMRMVANLLEAGLLPGRSNAGQLARGAPMAPDFGLADSGFRYAVLCLTMVHVVCAHKMRNADDTLSQCLKHLAETGVKQNSTDELAFFSSPVTIGQAYKTGNEIARQFMDAWSEWLDATRRDSGNARAGTPVVCAMLKGTESKSQMTEPDRQRLWPLACWFEDWIPMIDSSFDQLTGVKK